MLVANFLLDTVLCIITMAVFSSSKLSYYDYVNRIVTIGITGVVRVSVSDENIIKSQDLLKSDILPSNMSYFLPQSLILKNY